MGIDWKAARSVAAGVILAGLVLGLAGLLVSKGR